MWWKLIQDKHNSHLTVLSVLHIAALILFVLSPPQIIKDRVFSHISRNKYMWNSLPGGLLVLPEYSTHLTHFPFYYLGLGKQIRHSNGFAQHANVDWTLRRLMMPLRQIFITNIYLQSSGTARN